MKRTNFMSKAIVEKCDAAMSETAARKWQSDEEFYRERDNRTAIQIENLEFYAVRPIEIWLDPLVSDSQALQEIALLLSNLTARWARRIVVRFSASVSLTKNLQRDGFRLLDERILSEMKAADPFGDFKRLAYPAPVEKSRQNP